MIRRPIHRTEPPTLVANSARSLNVCRSKSTLFPYHRFLFFGFSFVPNAFFIPVTIIAASVLPRSDQQLFLVPPQNDRWEKLKHVIIKLYMGKYGKEADDAPSTEVQIS